MSISAQQVKELRDKTGAGMMDCKKALAESGGDEEQAIAWLRQKGLSKALKRADRTTSEGLIGSYLSEDGRVATLMEVQCETDFVAKADKFVDFAMGLAEKLAKNPPADATPEGLVKESAPKDASLTVQDQINELVAVLGESVNLGRFVRMEIPAGKDGVYGLYVHSTGKLGVVVEVLREDAKGEANDELKAMAKNLAMQVAAANPICVRPEELPQEKLDSEKEIYKQQAIEEGKPANIAEKIVEGRVKKYYQEVCLLNQVYIKDDKLSIQDLVKKQGKDLGESLNVTCFTRMQLGASS